MNVFTKQRVQQNASPRGFTLMELLVALTLFTIVITIAVGTLLLLIDANAKAQNTQQAMTNLTFALDSMSREIRTGRGYFCSTNANQGSFSYDANQDCLPSGSPGRFLSFIEGGVSLTAGESSNRIAYRFNASAARLERRIADNEWQPMTSEDVRITDAWFYVTGVERYTVTSDTHQPSITIYIEGEAGEEQLTGVDSSFSIQTTVSMRTIDL